MKSCLKATPPHTPSPSGRGTPNRSGNATPNMPADPPPLTKRVSFCQEGEGLEEFFEADDWDRTPAPVAPKLSYEEILELKQIMNSLPRAPTHSTFRQPFSSTSVPGPCTPPNFPVSRWASSPSLTPSKWKNRDDSRKVDPTILPYLDSVPIRLLPLLPPTPETPPSSQTATPPEASTPISASNHAESGSTAAAASSSTKPTDSSPGPFPSTSATPSTPTVVPSTPSPQTTPTKRKPNFAFVPLLPLKDESITPVVKIVAKPQAPVRKLNMTFVPLLPPTEPQAPAPEVPPIATTESCKDESIQVSQHVSKPKEEQVNSEPEAISTPPHSYIPLSLHPHSLSPTSTPSLSSASDTDTESEAPSVNSPSPSSPSLPDCDLSHLTNDCPSIVTEVDDSHNPYFPMHPSQIAHVISSEPGQTPPFSILFHSEAPSVVKKVQLQALPSPALIPPSPFSLNPPKGIAEGKAPDGPTVLSGTMMRRPFLARPSSLSSQTAGLCTSPPTPSPLGYALSPSLETPELTIESLRCIEPPSLDDNLGPSIRRK